MSEVQNPQTSEHRASIENLLKAGTHFGHLTRRWNPKMRSYIFMERNGIHIIDLMQAQAMLDAAAEAAARFARQGKRILFVGTKKQARETVRKLAESCGQPYVTERWFGGTLTNFQTIRRSISRMEGLIKLEQDAETFDQLKKKERLTKMREREKLERVLSGIADMPRLPGALYIVDINREHIAVNEARKLGIPIIAMVDTNCDPDLVDYAIPANDDAQKSIEMMTSVIAQAISEGSKTREIKDANREAERQKRSEDAQRPEQGKRSRRTSAPTQTKAEPQQQDEAAAPQDTAAQPATPDAAPSEAKEAASTTSEAADQAATAPAEQTESATGQTEQAKVATAEATATEPAATEGEAATGEAASTEKQDG